LGFERLFRCIFLSDAHSYLAVDNKISCRHLSANVTCRQGCPSFSSLRIKASRASLHCYIAMKIETVASILVAGNSSFLLLLSWSLSFKEPHHLAFVQRMIARELTIVGFLYARISAWVDFPGGTCIASTMPACRAIHKGSRPSSHRESDLLSNQTFNP